MSFMDVKWLGHASLQVELGGRALLFDPWLNAKDPHAERLVPPAVTQEQIRRCDLLFLTHEHFDHCDAYDVSLINSRTSCNVVAPQETLAMLSGVHARSKVAIREGDSFTLMGLDISVVSAKHPQSTNPVGYVVSSEREGKSIYVAGDTYDFADLSSIDVDVAVLPIGGSFTMDAIGAVTALKRLRAKYVIPYHYNTFARIKADVDDFAKRVKSSTRTQPIILQLGGQVSL